MFTLERKYYNISCSIVYNLYFVITITLYWKTALYRIHTIFCNTFQIHHIFQHLHCIQFDRFWVFISYFFITLILYIYILASCKKFHFSFLQISFLSFSCYSSINFTFVIFTCCFCYLLRNRFMIFLLYIYYITTHSVIILCCYCTNISILVMLYTSLASNTDLRRGF